MAYYVNKENMVLYCVVKSCDISVFRILNSEIESESHELKCPVTMVVHPVEDPQIITAAVSNCGKFVAACDSNNCLHLFSRDRSMLNYKSARKLVRKCHKMIFTNSGEDVIVADRSGDVYSFSTSDFLREAVFLLGHICLVTDVAISEDDKYLITCDRDGKIRVSIYPNAYHIYSYCLGHEEFVSSVLSVQLSQELILSASGDGSLRLWNLSGDSVCTVNVYENETLLKDAKAKQKMLNLSGAPTLLDEKRIRFAVKNVRFHTNTKMCAVLFYSVKGVALYLVSDSENTSFEFVQFIPTEEVVYDVVFNLNGDIIIIQNSVNEQYMYFKYVEGCEPCFQKETSSNQSLLNKFRSRCGRVEELFDAQEDYEMLFKRHFDDKEDDAETSIKSKKKKKLM